MKFYFIDIESAFLASLPHRPHRASGLNLALVEPNRNAVEHVFHQMKLDIAGHKRRPVPIFY